MEKCYVATVQVLVQANSHGEACDGIGETMREAERSGFVVDWSYLKVGGQHLSPEERFFNLQDYEEGDAFS